MLKRLKIENVGPARVFDWELGERLNLLTGDNGLGKTFLLDAAWYALTRRWANQPLWPDLKWEGEPSISAEFQSLGDFLESVKCTFSIKDRDWGWTGSVPSHALAIYVRVDEGFSVLDPARARRSAFTGNVRTAQRTPVDFTSEQLWNGLTVPEEDSAARSQLAYSHGSSVWCNGLIRDWVDWGYKSTKAKEDAFRSLEAVLSRLSPDPVHELIKPGAPIRLSVDDVREFPTMVLPYGTTPVNLASAGMKRILGLAYVLVWTWYEHQVACEHGGGQRRDSLIFLIDEVEAHLHPKWQRSILPSVLEVARILNPNIKTQIIATTHSPMVLASIEPYFDEEKDRVHILEADEKEITLSRFKWAKFGETCSWLTSPVFGLESARSKEAERAMDAAYAYMRGEATGSPNLESRDQIDQELRRVLPGNDPFFVGWDYHNRKLRQALSEA